MQVALLHFLQMPPPDVSNFLPHTWQVHGIISFDAVIFVILICRTQKLRDVRFYAASLLSDMLCILISDLVFMMFFGYSLRCAMMMFCLSSGIEMQPFYIMGKLNIRLHIFSSLYFIICDAKRAG